VVFFPNMEVRPNGSVHNVALYCSASCLSGSGLATKSYVIILFPTVDTGTRVHDFGDHTHCLHEICCFLVILGYMTYFMCMSITRIAEYTVHMHTHTQYMCTGVCAKIKKNSKFGFIYLVGNVHLGILICIWT
jgi:hypothetical protein